MIIFDKELKANMDESKRLEDIGGLFVNWEEANNALNLLRLEESRASSGEGRMEFYSKHEIWDSRLHGGMNRTETYDHYERMVN